MGKVDKCWVLLVIYFNECSLVSDFIEEIRVSILGEEEKYEKIEFDCSLLFFFGKIISFVYLIFMLKKLSKFIVDCWICMCNEIKFILCSWILFIWIWWFSYRSFVFFLMWRVFLKIIIEFLKIVR